MFRATVAEFDHVAHRMMIRSSIWRMANHWEKRRDRAQPLFLAGKISKGADGRHLAGGGFGIFNFIPVWMASGFLMTSRFAS